MKFPLAAVALVAAAATAWSDPGFDSHEIRVRIDAPAGRIEGTDRATVRRDGGGALAFRLREGLTVSSVRIDETDVQCVRESAAAGVANWRVELPQGTAARCVVTIAWSGEVGPGTAGASRVGPEGACLSSSDAWFPSGADAAVRIEATADTGWESTIGPAAGATGAAGLPAPSIPAGASPWTSPTPISGAWLAAGPWVSHSRSVGDVRCVLHLRARPDGDAVAKRIAAVVDHARLLAPAAAPPRFDVFETPGPRATLARGALVLPPEALAAPATEASPAPRAGGLTRDVLLTWFGGGAADSPASAVAGLVALDADLAGIAADVAAKRRRGLASLAAGRDDEARAARGVLFLHGLRRDVGAAAFRAALARGASASPASWQGWRKLFEAETRRDLAPVFAQGLDRAGLPVLEIGSTRVRTESGRILVSGVLRQRLAAGEAPWRVTVPVVVEHLEGRDETLIEMSSAECGFAVPSPSMPLRISIDPDNHLLRTIAAEEDLPGTPSRVCRLLLPDLRAAASPERIAALVSKLAATRDRVAGSPAEAAARRIVADEMRLAGVEPDEQAVVFSVKDVDAKRPVLASAEGVAVDAVFPLVASPETPEEGLRIVGTVGDDDEDVAGRALVVDLPGNAQRPMEFLRQAAALAVARRATALFVRRPAEPGPQVAALWLFPSSAPAGDDAGAALRRAAVAAATSGSDTEFALPVVAVPAGFQASKDAFWRLDVKFRRTEVRTANLVGRIPGRGRGTPGSVVLAASLDGGPGGDAGVATLLEAAQILAARPEFLARDVTLIVTAADSWGDRGRRTFARGIQPAVPPLAVVLVGEVGESGALTFLGCAPESRLGRTVAAAAAQSALDARAATGAMPAASVPWPRETATAVVASEDAAPRARADGAPFDATHAARVARALALTALAVSGGW